MAQIKRSVRPEYVSVFAFIFLCWSPYFQVFILPQKVQQRIWHTQYLQNIQLSPLSPSTTSLTADDFATFFTNKTRAISSQFSPPTQKLKPTTSTAKTPSFSFCPLTEAEVSKLLLSRHPTTRPLDQSPHTFSKQSPLHSYQHSHTSSTHLSLQAPSPLHSSRPGLPHCLL